MSFLRAAGLIGMCAMVGVCATPCREGYPAEDGEKSIGKRQTRTFIATELKGDTADVKEEEKKEVQEPTEVTEGAAISPEAAAEGETAPANESTAENEETVFPDLTVTNLELDFSNNRIIASVSNIGECATEKETKVAFYCYVIKKGREVRVPIHEETVGCMDCKDQNTIEVAAHTSTENLYRKIEVFVDGDGKIKEKHEGNNSLKFKTKKLPPAGFFSYDDLEL